MYINEVTLCGNLGGDPEVKSLQNGNQVASFNLATTESWKDKQSGERRERTQWHRIVIWNEGLVKLCEKHLAKGDQIYLKGQLETRKWQDGDGKDRFVTEVVLRPYASEIKINRCKAWDKNKSGGGGDAPAQGPKEQPPSFGSQPAQQRKPITNDDDIPF